MNVVKNILFAALAVAATACAPVLAASSGTPTAPVPSCCVGGNCCASGPCCDMPGCCKADKSCCDPATGACTSACGCLANKCCGGGNGAKKVAAKSRGHFVTEGKRTFWVPGAAPGTVAAKTPAASCCGGTSSAPAVAEAASAASCCAKK